MLRIASVMGVHGWLRANPSSQVGIVAMGTKALLAYGRNMKMKVAPLAASGEDTSIPAIAASHEIAVMNSAILTRIGAGSVVADHPSFRPAPPPPPARSRSVHSGAGTATRERIIQTAIGIADAEGIAAMSLRRIAGDLAKLDNDADVDFDLTALFEFGLTRLLDGFAALIDGRRRGRPLDA